ncbi:MAG: SIR2 family NAD-dependent protein deacylase, partial [Desulfosalsimonas sp.]
MEELINKAADDLTRASYAVALTGAGISTESGVPDFRGPDGIWTKNPEMEKKAYQTYHTFLKNPATYWKETLENPFRKTLLSVRPNPGHYALAELERLGILKAVISQNVDNLHRKAGSQRVLEYHGSVDKLRCLSCGLRHNREDYDLEQMEKENQLPPSCPGCGYPLKSDVVYFQEPIPRDVMYEADQEARKCDVMLICGTSALVYPFAGLPTAARSWPNVIIIEVNAE